MKCSQWSNEMNCCKWTQCWQFIELSQFAISFLIHTVKLNELIDVFSLIINLQMKDNEKLNINAQLKADLFLKCIDELQISVKNDEIKNIILVIVFSESCVIYTDWVNFSNQTEKCVFNEMINNHHDIDAFFFINIEKWWQIEYEVHSDVFSTFFENR